MASIQRSPYYADPNLSKSFDNLAGIFAPPSGMDAYAYAHAGQIKTDEARKAAALAAIKSGQGSLADYIAAGVADPANNYGTGLAITQSQQPGATPRGLDPLEFAIHGNAGNTFAGQDADLASKERTALVSERGKIIAAGMAPVPKDAVQFMPPAAVPVLNDGLTPGAGRTITSAGGSTPAPSLSGMFAPAGAPAPAAQPAAPAPGTINSPSVADMFGAGPAAAPPIAPEAPIAAPGPSLTRYGQTEVAPGSKIVRPDGTVLQGNPKPMTTDEVKAQELQRGRASGQITDNTMNGIIFGNTPLETVMGPDGKPKLATGPEAIGQTPAAKPEATKPTELAQLQGERADIAAKNPTDPRLKEYDQRIQALGRGQQQGAYEKANDENFAAENKAIFEAANNAKSDLATTKYVRNLYASGDTPQGFGAEAQVAVRKALYSLGITADPADNAQVAQMLSNKMTLALRTSGGTNLLPGNFSDGDRNFLAASMANDTHTQGANLKFLDYLGRMQQRTIDINDLRQQYVDSHGRLDEGWRKTLSGWTDAHPLFGDQPGYAEAQKNPVPLPDAAAAPASPSAASPDTAAATPPVVAPAAATPPAVAAPSATAAPADMPPDAKQAPDGNFYRPDPTRPGKYIQWK